MKQTIRAVTHPKGWGGLADCEISADGKIYRAVTHEDGGAAFRTLRSAGMEKSTDVCLILWVGGFRTVRSGLTEDLPSTNAS